MCSTDLASLPCVRGCMRAPMYTHTHTHTHTHTQAQSEYDAQQSNVVWCFARIEQLELGAVLCVSCSMECPPSIPAVCTVYIMLHTHTCLLYCAYTSLPTTGAVTPLFQPLDMYVCMYACMYSSHSPYSNQRSRLRGHLYPLLLTQSMRCLTQCMRGEARQFLTLGSVRWG